MLRAGLGFLHAAQELLPNADVGFIGVSRDEETFQPKSYVNKLPENLAGRQCIVPRSDAGDRRLAGPRLPAAHRAGRHRQFRSSSCACWPRREGIQVLEQAGLDLRSPAVDERLNEHALIVPGLGGAGDRQFGSPA
ncbi:MAG: uracil phosphoribosyltransferase [Ilumatobacteraceae bacterium]